jgi:hypothetical protein
MSNFITLKELQVHDKIRLKDGGKAMISKIGKTIRVRLTGIHGSRSLWLSPFTQVELLSRPCFQRDFCKPVSQC